MIIFNHQHHYLTITTTTSHKPPLFLSSLLSPLPQANILYSKLSSLRFVFVRSFEIFLYHSQHNNRRERVKERLKIVILILLNLPESFVVLLLHPLSISLRCSLPFYSFLFSSSSFYFSFSPYSVPPHFFLFFLPFLTLFLLLSSPSQPSC